MARAHAWAVLMLAGCGAGAPWPTSSVSLSNLRCDEACQSTADPFRMTLALDYEDPRGVLEGAKLAFTLDGVVDAGSEAAATFLGAKAKSGTLHFTVPLKLTAVEDGETFTLGVSVVESAGRSNEVSKKFAIHL